MTPSRRRICRPLIRSNFNSFAGTAMKNSATRQAIIKILGRKLQSEVASLCSTKLKSVLAEKPHDGMGNCIDLSNQHIDGRIGGKSTYFTVPTEMGIKDKAS